MLNILAALKAAKAGDVILLPPGDYGAVRIDKFKPTDTVTLRAEDPSNPPRFESVMLYGCENVVLDGLHVELPFSPTMVSHAAIVSIRSSAKVALLNSVVLGPVATTGDPENADPKARTSDFIIGRPTGRGVYIELSDEVLIEGNDISRAERGLVAYDCPRIVVRGNDIHDVRTSPVAMSETGLEWIVERNWLHSTHPWSYGGSGDHGGYVRMWGFKNKAKPKPMPAKVVVRENLLDRNTGDAILGIMIETDQDPWPSFEVIDNLIISDNTQAIALASAHGRIVGNIGLQPPPLADDKRSVADISKAGPSILFRGACDVEVAGNTLHDNYFTVTKKLPGGRYGENTLLPAKPDTKEMVDAYRAAWLAQYRPKPAPPEPDPEVIELTVKPGQTVIIRGAA